jgi:pyruvate formate lyase activating enzyme
MACDYCYNPEIVKGKGKINYSAALSFIDKRKGLLDGVVLSGGECTLHPGISQLAMDIQKRNMKVKIDTNGSRPLLLEELIHKKLVDYVALDFKALPHFFEKITGTDLYLPFEKNLDVLLSNQIPFEIRTTVHSDLISATDLERMADFLIQKGYQGTYFLQHFVSDSPTLAKLGKSSKNSYLTLPHLTDLKIEWRN